MNRDEMIEIAEKMLEYGGSFVKQIGGAVLHADPINMEKLDEAFGDLFESYRRFL